MSQTSLLGIDVRIVLIVNLTTKNTATDGIAMTARELEPAPHWVQIYHGIHGIGKEIITAGQHTTAEICKGRAVFRKEGLGRDTRSQSTRITTNSS